MYKFFYKLSLLLKRVIHYDKPLRVAVLAYLSLKFKSFKPHYESILYESCLEAKKLGINKVSVLELGVAGGNGIIALEKYKRKIEKVLDITIDIYGFDTGEGLPKTEEVNEDLPFFWRTDLYKMVEPLIKLPKDVIDGLTIATLEFEQKVLPFIIRRPLPNGISEYWNIKDLDILQ